jgi:maltose alpha-D-glucosyltransferase/alpha-amylase
MISDARPETPKSSRRLALIVANDGFRDPQLPDLAGPSRDAEALRRVLGAPDRGAFETSILLNASESEIRSHIFHLFRDAEPEDFVLLHYAGHGLRDFDGDGALYFAANNTEVSALPPTAVSSNYVLDRFEGCRAHKRLLILDCCYAGAATTGFRAADELQFSSEDLQGRGVAVITAATALQLARDTSGPARLSPFTAALIDGIENGEADANQDGWVSVTEAVSYVQKQLRRQGEPQTPRLHNREVEGDLLLARTVVPPTLREVIAWVESGDERSQLWAVAEIRQQVAARAESTPPAIVRFALESLLESESSAVAVAADRGLQHLDEVVPQARKWPRRARQASWFESAVFYEVLVRSFNDSNGDGVGDFQGLTEKLDYLEWLGVDALWVPPFFISPLRDGGYDVADYTDIQPEVGTVDDFHAFLDAAHARGIRVIIDFVMNHTSDQHPWFQASRSDPDGPYGDFYVWSDHDDLYQDARIIFVDTEPSNWTWDPVRQQYFWHRFYSHQPDLNYDNPRVQEAMLDGLKFWLDMGIDGFRLDAVPYLYERPGTNGENLKETHEFLKKVRRFVDENYRDKVLLAEANQWPSDVVDYFGEFEGGGDECHMLMVGAFPAQVMLAVRRESRFPVSEILEQTPAIPENCQWAIFLRNHDELTLEMLTDEDRDYMWGEYAKDPRMKGNFGMRRRLAPLLEDDRNQIMLALALLLSLPGTPVLYYGDEIGMGDNIWLRDRDGVRTPMQWTPDRNAGFSVATPGGLDLPVIQDPVFGYQRVNVEAELENASSLLHWTRRIVRVRKRSNALGLGAFRDLGGSNPRVLSFLREYAFEAVLCVFNLSRFPQPVELDLSRWEGVDPVELLGAVEFPRITSAPYPLTLTGFGFLWLRFPMGMA